MLQSISIDNRIPKHMPSSFLCGIIIIRSNSNTLTNLSQLYHIIMMAVAQPSSVIRSSSVPQAAMSLIIKIQFQANGIECDAPISIVRQIMEEEKREKHTEVLILLREPK